MKLKCPHCGKEFTANDEEYASIVDQIKNATFNEQVHNRLEDLKQKWESDEKNRQLIAKGEFDRAIADKEKTISELQSKVGSIGTQKDLEYKDEISGLKLKIQELQGELKAAADTEARNIDDARREEREKAGETLRQKEEDFNGKIRIAQEEIDRLKEFKQISKKAPRIYAKLEEARKENEAAAKAFANPDEQ